MRRAAPLILVCALLAGCGELTDAPPTGASQARTPDAAASAEASAALEVERERAAEQLARITDMLRAWERERAAGGVTWWHDDGVPKERPAGPPLPEGEDLSGGIPGAGLWCGTAERGGAWSWGLGWHGPDRDGVYLLHTARGAAAVGEIEVKPLFGTEEPERYGMGIGDLFHQSRPGESRDAFLARMRSLQAERRAAAEAAAVK